MAHPATPSLHADYGITTVDDAELDALLDAPLETVVHVLLPVLAVEVGLCLGEEEGIDAAVQVRVL